MINIVSAHSIINDTDFNLDNGVILTVKSPLTFNSISVYNSTDTPASTLEIVIGAGTIRLTPTASSTLTINGFDYASDTYNFTISGAGTTTLNQKVLKSNTLYNFYSNSAYTFGVTSDNTGWITKSGIVAGTYTYPTQYAPPMPGGGAPPSPPSPPGATPGSTPDGNQTGGSGGSGGAGLGTGLPNINDIAAQLPQINIKTIAATDTGAWLFYLLMLLGVIMMVLGASSKKVTRTTMFWGLAFVIFSSYALDVIK